VVVGGVLSDNLHFWCPFGIRPELRCTTASRAQPTTPMSACRKFFFVQLQNFLSSIFVVAMIRDISGTAHGVNFANAAAYLFFQKWGGVAELHFLQTKNAVPCSACALSVLMANAVRIEKEIFSVS
jgi:hypothetical protein